MDNSPLLKKFNEYETWRANLSDTISGYRDWLSRSPLSDSIKELRLHDMVETMQRDEIVIAFLADESRGKTEIINALFFSDLNLHLLSSEAGKSSRCSSEIYWNTNEEPSISLLPISTRRTEDTLAYLKTTPKVWETYKLNLGSVKEMQATLSKLTEQLEVSQSEAISLGLWDPNDTAMVDEFNKTDRIKVPLWRHALINYPHPALQGGLVIIDTPGLDKLSAEPELTLNIIPNADAVVFLTAADVKVTTSDITIWNEFIRNRTKDKFVLLNKVDLLRDKTKPQQKHDIDIDRLVNVTAHQLHTTPDIVFPVSARQALSAKYTDNVELLSESKLPAFEEVLGDYITQTKRAYYGKTMANECSEMIKSARQFVQQRKLSTQAQVAELRDLKGKSISESEQILKKVIAEKKRYEASLPTFNLANEKISKHGKNLLKHLSVEYLDSSIKQSRQDIGDSWTTAGLNKGMRKIMKQANDLAAYVTKESKKIKKLADNVYSVFHSKHGFEIVEAPVLDMSGFLNSMHVLETVTDEFCKDPINVMTEKHFLLRKFFLGLGTQKEKIFEEARKECENWLLDVLSTLKLQMAEHKATLDERTKNLMQANDSAKALDDQLKAIEKEHRQFTKESQAIDAMLLHIVTAAQGATPPKVEKPAAIDKQLDMPALSIGASSEAAA